MANIEGPCRDKELIYALIRFTDPPINNTIEYRAKLLKKFRGTMGIVETQCSDNNFDNILYELIENKNRIGYQDEPQRITLPTRPTNKYVMHPKINRTLGGGVDKRIKKLFSRRKLSRKNHQNNKKSKRRRISK